MRRLEALDPAVSPIRSRVDTALDLFSVWRTQAIQREPLFCRRRSDALLPVEFSKIVTAQVRNLPENFDPVPFQPRPDVRPLALTVPVDWDQDPFKDRNWRAQLNMVRFTDAYLARFEQSGHPGWLRWPIELLLDWHHFHVILQQKSRYGWGDMIAGQRAARLAYVIGADIVRPGVLTRKQRVLLTHSALAHVHRMIEITPVRLSNHTVDDLIGLRALQQVLSGRRVHEQIDGFVADVLPRLLAFQFTANGVHRENSPAYHFYILNKLRHLLKTQWFSGFGLEELLERAQSRSHWFHQPDGHVAPVGDSSGHAAGRLIGGFSPETGLRCADGYVIQRDCTAPGQFPPESYFFFMGFAHSGFHKHNDCLSYAWFDKAAIVTDTGKYAYKNNPERDYAVSARAHNTVEIGECDPMPNTLAGLMKYPWAGDLIRAAQVSPFGTLVSGRVVHARLHAAHTRTVLFRPGRFVLTADLIEDLPDPWPDPWPTDWLGGPAKTRPVTQWTHFAPAIQMQRTDPFGFTGLTQDARMVQLRLATAEAQMSGASAAIHRGQSEPRLQGWASEAYGKLTPRDAIGLTSGHRGRTWLASLITLGAPATCLRWEPDGRLSAEFADETVILEPSDGHSTPAAHS